MDMLKLCVLLCCLLSGACARSLPEFDEETTQLIHRIKLTPACYALVPGVVRDVLLVLHTRFSECEADLFGSIATGLGIIESDIDVLIKCRLDNHAGNITASEFVLETADMMLQNPQLFEVIKAKPLSRVPITKIKHLPSGFNIDISFSNYNGVRISKLIKYLMSVDERARDLALILKYWVTLRINVLTKHKLLTSHTIVTMAIFYLQQKGILPPIALLQINADKFIVNHWNMGFTEDKYKSKNNESLCALVGGFFKYYSEFDFDNYVVSPYVGYPIQIDLFRDLITIPDEFYIYKSIVGQNITFPLELKPPIVQDMFEHNSNLASYITDSTRNLLIKKAIRYAAIMYEQGCPVFLNAIFY